MDGVEQFDRLFGLVGLQGPDHVDLNACKRGPEGGPFSSRLLHIVFAEDALAFCQDGVDAVIGLDLGHRDQGHGPRGATCGQFGGGQAGADFGKGHWGLMLLSCVDHGAENEKSGHKARSFLSSDPV